MRSKRLISHLLLCAAVLPAVTGGQARSANRDIETAMVEAATFFRSQLSVEGSYVWTYNAADLDERRGEGSTNLSQGWSQPPGTPAVGLAYLSAFKATGRTIFLDAAKETAYALIRTQLESGGWQGLLEFDPAARRAWCYRIDAKLDRPDCDKIENNKLKDGTSLDDNISQAPLTFLMRLDEELEGGMDEARKAVIYGLDRFLDAQYPNGAWAFRFDFKIPNELTNSAWRSRYPDDWSKTFVKPGGEVYVVNDHLIRDTIRMFLLAYEIYDEPAYLMSAKRGGDFLLASQMPPPQPGWAQVYNEDLEPIWGRPFEPPSIASNETAGSIEALIELYLATGEQRYLDGVQPAADWLVRARLPSDDWARFYELGSNKPLYVDTDYKITYSDRNLPDHYGFVGSFGIPQALDRYRQAAASHGKAWASPVPKEAKVAEMIDALDKDGRWVKDGAIESAVFVKRLGALASFAAAQRKETLTDYLFPVRHQLDP